jgi:hypothetical protein
MGFGYYKVWNQKLSPTQFKIRPNFESYIETIPISYSSSTKLPPLDKENTCIALLSTAVTHAIQKLHKFKC